MLTAERNKRLQSAATSNKVETYAMAPPSILGSFVVFGRATTKTRDKKKGVAEHLQPPPVLQSESQQHFRYELPSDEHHPSFFFQEPSKGKQFHPSQQIGEFPAAYSMLGDAQSFEPFYKTFLRTTTKFGDGDVTLLPQSVGIQVSSSAPFPKPGQIQDVRLRPSRLNAATGSHLSDQSFLLPGSSPLTSFENQVYVTTWPPQPQQQYFSKLSRRPVTQPYFQEADVAEANGSPFVPTQIPSSQTYIRKPVLSEQTTVLPPHMNEVRLRKPLLPTPLTEEEESETSKDLYLFPGNQNDVRTYQSQRIRLPTTSSPEEEKQPQDVIVDAYHPKRPVNSPPDAQLNTERARRPNYSQKQPDSEGQIIRGRRPVSRNKLAEQEQNHRKRRPISEEVTTQVSATEPEPTPTTPVTLDSSAFHSRRRVPTPHRGHVKDRTSARPLRPHTTEKSMTESPWSSDDYAYDPELQSTSQELYEPHTLNEVTGDDFMSTKSGIPSTTATTSTTTTTTTTTTTIPPTTTARTRLRFPANTTRPRFSLRDHKERLERLSALSRKPAIETKSDEGEAGRGRNRSKGSVTQKEDEEGQSSGRVRQREPSRTRQRFSTTTSSTTEAHVTMEPSSTTERVNHFKPTNSRYRPSKYYSGYRSRTTEAATDVQTSASSTTQRTIVKPKPVFSVTRKPYPLRTRQQRVSTTTTTTTTEQAPLIEDSAVSASEPEANARVTNYVPLQVTENEIVPIMAEKADTTTAADDEAETPATDATSPEQDTLSPSQIVADLTSSATSGGYFSKRPNLRITMATEDPILPIEAFFPVRSSRGVLS
jgi:hypothetical protein